MGTSLSRLEARLDASGIPEENLKVSVAIFTDGMENSSRNFSLGEVKALTLRFKESEGGSLCTTERITPLKTSLMI